MLTTLRHLFLSTKGRIARRPYMIALVTAVVFNVVWTYFYKNLPIGQTQFFLGLIWFVLNIVMFFAINGKRLHDMGRSIWVLIGFVCLNIAIMVIVQLKFGGLEYFDTLMKTPEMADDPAAMQAHTKTYQENLKRSLPYASYLFSVLPVLFCLWLSATPGQKTTNVYGEPV